VLRTTNGGASWSTIAHPYAGRILDVAMADATTVITTSAAQEIAYSTTTGASWATQVVPVAMGYEIWGVDAASPRIWVASARRGAARTTNASGSWSQVNNALENWSDVAAVGDNDYWMVSTNHLAVVHESIAPIPDYGGANLWSGSNPLFGACLHARAGGAQVAGDTWVEHATCAASDGAHWNPIPTHGGAPGAKVATTTSSGTVGATVGLRFGFEPASTQQPGDYSADIMFEVVAPNA
jgi:hypothetical protein